MLITATWVARLPWKLCCHIFSAAVLGISVFTVVTHLITILLGVSKSSIEVFCLKMWNLLLELQMTPQQAISQHSWEKVELIPSRYSSMAMTVAHRRPSGSSPADCTRPPKSHLCHNWPSSLKLLTWFCYKRKLNSGISWDNLCCFLHS